MKTNDKLEKDISDLKYAIHGNFVSQAIAAACRMDLFDNFTGKDEILRLDQLAEKTQSHSYSLMKLLNFLVTIDVLSILPDRKSYQITSKGELLKKSSRPSLHYFARLHATSLFRGASDYLFQSIKDNKPGTSYFCDKGMFGHLKMHDQDNDVFNKAMSDLTSMHADSVGKFIKNLEISSILDAGGGVGTLLCGILRQNPGVKGTILDLPNVKDAALEYVNSSGFSDRISFISKSFFEEFQTESDLITLHHVLHDYDDEACMTILKNCKKALTRNGSILIIETLLGKDAEIGVGWLKDLIMHVITLGGRVRSSEEFQLIFDRAGLELQQIHTLTSGSSDLSIIQIRAKDSTPNSSPQVDEFLKK
jgi:16S rRNA G1207 methylase RsmC